MLRRAAVLLLAALLVGAGCSGDDGDASPSASSPEANILSDPCDLIDQLAETANELVAVGPSDPQVFSETLDAAVADFVAIVDALIETVPDDLADDLDEMRGLTEQYRFREAANARSTLDEYARRECDRRVSTDSTPSPQTSAPAGSDGSVTS